MIMLNEYIKLFTHAGICDAWHYITNKIGAIINDGLVTGWSVYYIWCTYITVW